MRRAGGEPPGKGRRKMKLAEMKTGERSRVVAMAGADAVKKRLGALGFVPGVVVRVVGASYGNMIVAVHESRIAVDSNTARDIEVETA